mgnify:CR=1 FL=1
MLVADRVELLSASVFSDVVLALNVKSVVQPSEVSNDSSTVSDMAISESLDFSSVLDSLCTKGNLVNCIQVIGRNYLEMLNDGSVLANKSVLVLERLIKSSIAA